MRNRIRIYIGDDVLDTFPDTVVAQTIKSNSIGTLATRNVNYTNNFRIPLTNNNDLIVGNLNVSKSAASFVYQLNLARVVLNGVTVIKDGLALFKKEDDYYNLSITYGGAEFFDEVGSKTLEELDLSAINGFWDMDATANASSGVVSPVINYGKFSGLDIHDQTYLPSVYYKTVLEQIITDAGYAKSGNIFADGRYLKHILPFGRPAFTFNPKYFSDRKAIGIGSAINLGDVAAGIIVTYGSALLQDPLGFFVPGTGLYSAILTGASTDDLLFLVKVTVTIDITVTGGGTIDLIAEDSTFASQSVLLSNKGTGVYTRSSVDADVPIEPYIAALQGRAVQLRAITNTGTASVLINSITTTIEVYPAALETQFFDYAKLLPSMTQRDFFKDFAIRFGQLFKEQDKTLYCKSIEDVINDRANAVDWTSKRIRSRETIDPLPRGFAQSNYYEHKITDYGLLLTAQKLTGRGVIEVANDNLELEKTQYTSPFEASITESTEGINMAYIPIYTDGQVVRSFSNDPGPRICLVRDKRASEPNVIFKTSQSSYKVAYFDDGSEPYISAGFQEGIDQFYPGYQLALQQYKLISRYYLLNENDIANLDTFLPVYDNGEYFIIDTISNWIPGIPVRATLLKI